MTDKNTGAGQPAPNIIADEAHHDYVLILASEYPPHTFIVWGFFEDDNPNELLRDWGCTTGNYRFNKRYDLADIEIRRVAVNDDNDMCPYGKPFWINEKDILS